MTTFDTSTAGSGGGLGGAAGMTGSGPGGVVTPQDIERVQREAEANADQHMTPAQRAEQDNHEVADAPIGGFAEGDTLALLAQRAAEVQAAEAPEHTVYGYGRQFKIVCRASIAERQLRGWQRKSLPQGKRKASANNISMFDMDQRRLAMSCLHDTATELWVRKGVDGKGVEHWAKVETDGDTGSIFDDQRVKTAFGAIDRDTVLNRIFAGSDGPLIRAGTEVMSAAGWADEIPGMEADDDDDEYDELNPSRGR
jgi:hypothetical protein